MMNSTTKRKMLTTSGMEDFETYFESMDVAWKAIVSDEWSVCQTASGSVLFMSLEGATNFLVIYLGR